MDWAEEDQGVCEANKELCSKFPYSLQGAGNPLNELWQPEGKISGSPWGGRKASHLSYSQEEPKKLGKQILHVTRKWKRKGIEEEGVEQKREDLDGWSQDQVPVLLRP